VLLFFVNAVRELFENGLTVLFFLFASGVILAAIVSIGGGKEEFVRNELRRQAERGEQPVVERRPWERTKMFGNCLGTLLGFFLFVAILGLFVLVFATPRVQWVLWRMGLG